MAFLLNGTSIRGPKSIQESNSTQVAQQRTLSGAYNRDYIGSNKRIWQLTYQNVNVTAFSVLQSIYDTYLTTGTTVTWEVTEDNYTIEQTNVHVDLLVRSFTVSGSSYISNFTLTLTEE